MQILRSSPIVTRRRPMLIAKSVEIAPEDQVSALRCLEQRRLGCLRPVLACSHDVPRYFVPLTIILARAKAQLHHKWTDRVPDEWRERLVSLRNSGICADTAPRLRQALDNVTRNSGFPSSDAH